MNIAERITKLREAKGLSVNKLANIAGLSQSFVRQIELGEKNPTIDSLNLICEALDITLSNFFSEEPLPIRAELIMKLNEKISCLTINQLKLLLEVAKALND